METHTSTFSQATEYLVECMRHEARNSNFFIMVLIALALGGLCWFLATQYTKLWNLRYNATFRLQILCAIAAALTVVFTIAFVSLDYAKEIARERLSEWHATIKSDRQFLNQTFVRAYYEVKNRRLERFDPRLHPPPPSPDARVPLTNQRTMIFVGQLYADAALANFRKTNPFLSSIIMPANADVPAPIIAADINRFFAIHRGEKNPTYLLDNGVDMAAGLFASNLEAQTPKVVTKARRWITLLFLLVQLIPFGLIGYSAYMDLKSNT